MDNDDSDSHNTEDFVFIWKPLLKSEFLILGLILTCQIAHLASPSLPVVQPQPKDP